MKKLDLDNVQEFTKFKNPVGGFICEIKSVEDVPEKVAINEAVELAKKYCDEKEPSFINGLLGHVMRQL